MHPFIHHPIHQPFQLLLHQFMRKKRRSRRKWRKRRRGEEEEAVEEEEEKEKMVYTEKEKDLAESVRRFRNINWTGTGSW